MVTKKSELNNSKILFFLFSTIAVFVLNTAVTNGNPHPNTSETLTDKLKKLQNEPIQCSPVKNNYNSKILFSFDVTQMCSKTDFFIPQFDMFDNMYLVCGKFVNIFDKTGKLVKAIPWDRPRQTYPDRLDYLFWVDEVGNILLAGNGKVYALNRDKGFISSFKGGNGWNMVVHPAFSGGNLYQMDDGKVLYTFAGFTPRDIKPKYSINHFQYDYEGSNIRGIKTRIDGKDVSIPRRIGNYNNPDVKDIDALGNIYIQYNTPLEYEKHDGSPDLYFRKSRVYVFDSALTPLAHFNFSQFSVNRLTGELYCDQTINNNPNQLNILKWMPSDTKIK